MTLFVDSVVEAVCQLTVQECDEFHVYLQAIADEVGATLIVRSNAYTWQFSVPKTKTYIWEKHVLRESRKIWAITFL